MVCFVLRPGPPPTGLKPPLINYTSTSTTAATTPLDFMDGESMMPDGVMYDEMTVGGGAAPGPADTDPLPVTTEMTASTTAENSTAPYSNGSQVDGTTLIYDSGGGGGGVVVRLYGKSSGSDRNKHRQWTQANHTAKTNFTFGSNKVRGRAVFNVRIGVEKQECSPNRRAALLLKRRRNAQWRGVM